MPENKMRSKEEILNELFKLTIKRNHNFERGCMVTIAEALLDIRDVLIEISGDMEEKTKDNPFMLNGKELERMEEKRGRL